MLKKIIIISLFTSFFWGCTEQKIAYSTHEMQHVSCDWNSKVQLRDWIAEVTIVPLAVDNQHVFSNSAMLYVHKGDHYVVDNLQLGMVYRFDSLGNYKNTIGRIGSGPQEYLVLTDFSINDQNEILIYSRLNNAKFHYQPDGSFLRKTHIADPFIKATSLGGREYLYLGYNNTTGQGRLSRYDTTGSSLRYSLSSAPKVLMMDEITPVFSQHKDRIFLRETFNDTIFMIANDQIAALYEFDFSPYAISDQFWTQTNADQSTMILLNSDFATIKQFFENDDYSLVEIQLQKRSSPDPSVGYGLQNKETRQWTWLFFNQPDDSKQLFLGNARSLSDQNEILLLIDSQSLLEIKDRTIFSNPESLSLLSRASSTVLVRCKLK